VLIDVQSYSDLISTKRSTPFWPGMTASVDIKTETREQTLAIPIAAVTTRNPKAALGDEPRLNQIKTWVFKYENGRVKAIQIKTGIQDIDHFELISGLKEGDEIVVEPGIAVAKTLSDGQKVNKTK